MKTSNNNFDRQGMREVKKEDEEREGSSDGLSPLFASSNSFPLTLTIYELINTNNQNRSKWYILEAYARGYSKIIASKGRNQGVDVPGKSNDQEHDG